MPHRTPGSLRALACAAGAAVLIAGCGNEKSYKNDPRPAAPINVTAYVGPKRVSVSPASFGAGPIVVIVANQSNASQEVTFQGNTGGGSASTKVEQSALVGPGETGQLKLNVRSGAYQVKTGDDSIAPARVTVGRNRSSAQNELLQP